MSDPLGFTIIASKERFDNCDTCPCVTVRILGIESTMTSITAYDHHMNGLTTYWNSSKAANRSSLRPLHVPAFLEFHLAETGSLARALEDTHLEIFWNIIFAILRLRTIIQLAVVSRRGSSWCNRSASAVLSAFCNTISKSRCLESVDVASCQLPDKATPK